MVIQATPPHPSMNNEEEVREIPNLDSNTQGNTKEKEEGVKRTRMINPGDRTVEKGSTGCSLDERGSPPPFTTNLRRFGYRDGTSGRGRGRRGRC